MQKVTESWESVETLLLTIARKSYPMMPQTVTGWQMHSTIEKNAVLTGEEREKKNKLQVKNQMTDH